MPRPDSRDSRRLEVADLVWIGDCESGSVHTRPSIAEGVLADGLGLRAQERQADAVVTSTGIG